VLFRSWYGSLLFIPAALAAIALALDRRRLDLAVLAAVLAGLALYRTIPVGNRLAALDFVGALIVFAYVRVGKRPRTSVLIGTLAVGLVGSYALLAHRDAQAGDGTVAQLRALASNPARVFSPLYKGADAEMAPAVAGALLAIPDRLHYRYGGATLGDLVTRPIPRQLWSHKPLPPGQRIVARAFPFAHAHGGPDPAFTPLVFFFWDFGLVGVAVGMACFGVLARALYEAFQRSSGELAPQLFFAAALWFVVIGVRNDPVDTVVQALFLLVPLAGILFVGRSLSFSFIRQPSPKRGLPHARRIPGR